MKKYFIAETDEELQFGDKIKLDLTKKTKHGSIEFEGEVEFSKLSLPLLLEVGAVEEREVEEDEDNDLLDFDEDECDTLEEVLEDYENLEERVGILEEEVCKLTDLHKDYMALTDKMYNTLASMKEVMLELSGKKETASSKKK